MTVLVKRHVARVLVRRTRAAFMFGALALGAVSCDVHKESGPGSVVALLVSPSPSSMPINGTQQFVAKAVDFEGITVGGTPVWSVVSGGGSISPSGLFTAGTVTGTYASTVK